MWTRCEECQRLWREYAFATTDHVRLGNNLLLAALKCDRETIAILTAQLESAAEKRQSSREAFRGHETQHGRAATAGHGLSTQDPHHVERRESR
jgi:hypothetical protein